MQQSSCMDPVPHSPIVMDLSVNSLSHSLFTLMRRRFDPHRFAPSSGQLHCRINGRREAIVAHGPRNASDSVAKSTVRTLQLEPFLTIRIRTASLRPVYCVRTNIIQSGPKTRPLCYIASTFRNTAQIYAIFSK